MENLKVEEVSNAELANLLNSYCDYGNPRGLNSILKEAANRLRVKSQKVDDSDVHMEVSPE